MDQAGAGGNGGAVTFRAGVHLANDGILADADLDLLAGIRLVKALVRLDTMGQWGEVDFGRLAARLDPDCLVILRLYPGGYMEPWNFAARSAERLFGIRPVLGDREVRIEIHNEPNHESGLEGWGAEDHQSRQFAAWFLQVIALLRAYGLRGLGWPGLALGEWAHRERSFAKINAASIAAADWIGCHCYWQRPEEITRPALGENWRWYTAAGRRRGREVFVTEAANSSCHNADLPQVDPGRQAAEAVAWCRAAAAGGVSGVAFFMLGGTEEWSGFRLYPETVRALAGADFG